MKTAWVMKLLLEVVGDVRSLVVAVLFAVGTYKLKSLKVDLDPRFYAFATFLVIVALGHGARRVVKSAKLAARDYAIIAVGREVEKAKTTLRNHTENELAKMDRRCLDHNGGHF